MSKQLSIFSLLKKNNNPPLQEDTNKVVKSCLDDYHWKNCFTRAK